MPYAVWIEGLTDDGDGGPTAVRGSVALGAVYFGWIFHWVPLALYAADPGIAAAGFAAGSYVLIVVGLTGLAGLFGGLLHHSVRRLGAPVWLALPVAWTAFEWTRAHLPDSLALPWLGLGASLTAVPELVGAAEIVGGRGITFWLAAVNGLLATAWIRRSRGAAVAAVGAVVVVGGWGFWRADRIEPRTVARIAVVQPDVARGRKLEEGAPNVDGVAAALPSVVEERSEGFAVQAASVDVVVLPELFLRADPRSPTVAGARQAIQAFSRAVGAPVIFGALGADAYNSSFLMRVDGLDDYRYDKRRLVPVIERVPFQPGSSAYQAGVGWPLAEVGGHRYGVFICYESSYPEVARALRLHGADVLVNITNDAWLEGIGPLRRTVALRQHPAHLVMRAVEGRVGVVRSAATGVSMFVDPVGRTHDVAESGSREVRVADVRTVDGLTVYHRYGDIVGTASAFVGFVLLAHLLLQSMVMGRPTRPRQSSLDPQGPRV